MLTVLMSSVGVSMGVLDTGKRHANNSRHPLIGATLTELLVVNRR